MSERSPRQPRGPTTGPSRSGRAARIVADAGVDDATADIIARAYTEAKDSEIHWRDRQAARDLLDPVLADLACVETVQDLPSVAAAVDGVRARLERIAELAHDADVAAAVDRMSRALCELRAELGRGRYDRARWWPSEDGHSPLFDSDLRPALVRSLRWRNLARSQTPVVEARVMVVLRCHVARGLCFDDKCDHPGCGRPGDVASVALSDAKLMCALVSCTNCWGDRMDPAVDGGAQRAGGCSRCGGSGVVPGAAEPFDDEARRALEAHSVAPARRRGTHSDAAVQAALLAGERQRLTSRTAAERAAADYSDGRVRCSPEDLPRVVAAVLHRAGLGSEGARTRSLEALTRRVAKIFQERVEDHRKIEEDNALRVTHRRTNYASP